MKEEESQIFKQLFLKVEDITCCPNCSGDLELDLANNCLTCQTDPSHNFPILEGIPSFVKREEISPEDAEWVSEYDEKAEQYDEAIRREADRMGIDLTVEFSRILERVPVKPSCHILDVSTGTGALIFRIEQVFPDVPCRFAGVDLSIGMLRVAQRKFIKAKMEEPLFHSRVMKLPFKDGSFDIVTHFGGINTFRDIPTALKEWVRVLKSEGYLLVVDEGVSPALRKTRKGANLIKENWLFGLQPPLEHLPPQVKNVEVRWVVRDMFYAISCHKSSEEELKELQPLRIWLTASK